MGCNAALKYFISMDPSFKEPGAMQRYLELIGDECSKNLTLDACVWSKARCE